MPDYKAGELVWVHIGGGYGWWPCQVMEPHHTPEQRRADVLRIKRPGCVLVHCHGDDTFNWFDPRDIKPLTDNYAVRAAQKHKSAAVKKYFKLALEQAQEIIDNREGRPPSTSHKPVDFTRPETYEHLIAPMPADAADDYNSRKAADAMRHPAAATAEDGSAVAAAVVMQWLIQTAAEPGERCKELVAEAADKAAADKAAADKAAATSSEATAEDTANADTADADEPSSAAAEAALTPVCMRLLWSYLHTEAVDEHGPNKFLVKKKSAKRKMATAAATGTAAIAAAVDGSSGKGKKQQQQPGAEAVSEEAQKAKKRKSDASAGAEGSQQQHIKKRRKQQQQQPAAVDQSLMFYNIAPSADDEYLFRYGGPIPGAVIKKAVQFLFQAALNPEPIVSHLTHSHAKAIAMLVRWREAVVEESHCKEQGCVHKIVKGMLIRADAYPIPPAHSPAAAAGSSRQQQQQDDFGVNSEDEGSSREDGYDQDHAGSDQDDLDLNDVSGVSPSFRRRARKPPRSSRGLGEDEKSALVAIKAAQAASKQERNFLRRQQLASLRYTGNESDSSGEVGRDDDSSSDWGAAGDSSKQQHHKGRQQDGSPTAAAAAGGGSDGAKESTAVEIKQYSGRILATPNLWSSDVQRWSAERGKEATFSKVCSHTVTTTDAHTIFRLVADRGGFDAASQRHAWLAIAREWHSDLAASSKNVSSQLKKWYANHLLDYEMHISAGCPTITKAFSLKGRKRAIGPGEPRPAPRRTLKVKQEPVADDDSSDDDEEPGKAAAGRTVKREPKVKVESGAAAAAEGPRRRLALPQSSPAAAASPSSKPAAAADHFIAAAAGGDKHNNADRRLVKFTFRQGYRVPPLLTVLKAAQKYQHDINIAMIRVYLHQPVASILFSSASIAEYAAEGFRKYGRRMLRIPDDELFEVELTWLPNRRVDSGRDASSQASNSSRTAAAEEPAAAPSAAAVAAANYPEADKCLMRIHYHHGYKMPPIQTIHQTAKRFQRDIERASVRVYKHDYIASVFFKDAATAAAAAEWYRQNGRQALKVPEDEKFEVELTWLVNKNGEVVKPRGPSSSPYVARASDYVNSAADSYKPQAQQQQQHAYPRPPQSSGPRPMISLAAAAAGLGQQQQQQPTFALPGGIVIVPGPAPIGVPLGAPGLPAAAAAAAMPGLGGAAVSQSHVIQQPLLLDPRRQQQQPLPPPPPHVPPPQPPPHPPPPQQQQQPPVLMMSAPQHVQQPQQPPAQQTVLPIIDLAALANAIGLQQQQQPPQQQHLQQLQLPLQHQQPPPLQQQQQQQQLPMQLQQPQPQLPIHQLQLPQMQPLPPPPQQQQQQQVSQTPWHQAEFQAKLQDLLRDLGHGTRTG